MPQLLPLHTLVIDHPKNGYVFFRRQRRNIVYRRQYYDDSSSRGGVPIPGVLQSKKCEWI